MVWKGRNFVTIKLVQLRGPIVQLLNYLVVPSKSTILRNLLDEAEYFTMQIPETEEEMATDWREKLSQWWTVFATKNPSDDYQDEKAYQPSAFPLPSNVSFFLIEYASPYQENVFQQKNPTMEEVLSFLEYSLAKFASSESLPKAEVLQQLKDLLLLVNRTEKLSFIYLSDTNFQQIFLKHVISKLPSELQAKFADTSSLAEQGASLPDKPSLKRTPSRNVLRPKTVNNLKDFLIDELQALDKELKEEQRIEALYSKSSTELPSENIPKCAFCQIESHPLLNCPKVNFFSFRLF